MKDFSSNYFDSLITDPPAGIDYLKSDWDSSFKNTNKWIRHHQDLFESCYRVLKPGAFGFVWALPRVSHRTATALEKAGFKIKDIITHVYATGFPKSQYVSDLISKSKKIDLDYIYKVTAWVRKTKEEKKLSNADIDKFVGSSGAALHWVTIPPNPQAQIPSKKKWEKLLILLGKPPDEIAQIVSDYHSNKLKASDKINELATKWQGWGTSLKPASEHWLLIQKPIERNNIGSNLKEHGVGAININDSRIYADDLLEKEKKSTNKFYQTVLNKSSKQKNYRPHENGRFPANFLMSRPQGSAENKLNKYFKTFEYEPYFYSPKPSKKEKGVFNHHPTVKPLKLINYLTKLITPENGIVLDPFMGSGTTGVSAILNGYQFVGIEKDSSFFQIAKKRTRDAVRSWKKQNNQLEKRTA